MRIKKKTNLIVIILTFTVIFGFLTYAFKRTAITSNHIINYPKISADSIIITRPDNSSSWEAGETEWIYYEMTVITNVDIELYRDGLFVIEIGADFAGTGALLWKIPSDLVSSTNYQIKIIDHYNPSLYNFSDFFEIYSPKQSKGISGYNLYIIIGSICIISLISATCIVIILKKKKH